MKSTHKHKKSLLTVCCIFICISFSNAFAGANGISVKKGEYSERETSRSVPHTKLGVKPSVFGRVPDDLVRDYSQRVSRHIWKNIGPNIIGGMGNPRTLVRITQNASGNVLSMEIVDSSGSSDWDIAVSNAVAKSSPLPLAEDGSFESVIELSFRRYAGVSSKYLDDYVFMIVDHIRKNVVYNRTDLGSNPRVRFRITQHEFTGKILSFEVVESSGDVGWDKAVEEAIAKSSPLPSAKDGAYEKFIIVPVEFESISQETISQNSQPFSTDISRFEHDYMNSIIKHVYKDFVHPRLNSRVLRSYSRPVVFSVSLDVKGRVLDYKKVTESGFLAFDNVSGNAIRDASPLPPPPIPRFLRFQMPFVLKVE